MIKKRYAIVRVDNRCPDFFCKYKVMKDEKSFSCNDCNLHRKYGDTKEQFVAKVAQVLFQEKIKFFCKTFGKAFLDKEWEQIYLKEALKEARKIVEFLGVKK